MRKRPFKDVKTGDLWYPVTKLVKKENLSPEMKLKLKLYPNYELEYEEVIDYWQKVYKDDIKRVISKYDPSKKFDLNTAQYTYDLPVV